MIRQGYPSPDTLLSFERQLNTIRENAMSEVGQQDADYIRRVIRVQRASALLGRVIMVLGFFSPVWWLLGVALLGLAKILDNMEIGHNVMHGQYDWMNDPHINSRRFEWDIVGDADSWKRVHNFEHHTYTNIIGKDRDFGYGVLRLSDDLPWRPKNRWQIFSYAALSLLFQWGVAYHEVAGERIFVGKPKKDSKLPISRNQLKNDFFQKIRKSTFKDYVFFPLVAGLIAGAPMILAVLVGNAIANLIRNIWTSTIIFCGHFTEDVHTFNEADCENETRGQWYYRQILGSSNMEGPVWFHILTGHLSCQIEHHLYPDVPAHRYRVMAKQVRQVCAEHNIPYNSGSFLSQYVTVLQRIWKYSFPTKNTVTESPAS
ncbi:MAG: acyl-CoA desaturase [Oceanospirillales bacterium]|jgi:fatty acid desaturase|uniref:fatty acid desaturase family protein n=1 Tax=Thalassolituus oleivorans TaxID=187493 RepID=UPI000BD26778|nr:acyl-CoA desaturase [Thalassolituus oleivorans]PCI50214.1 MAG: acyl-CoA desaturase [Oceanospirillales bacterium]